VAVTNHSADCQVVTNHSADWQLVTNHNVDWQLFTKHSPDWKLVTNHSAEWQLVTNHSADWQLVTKYQSMLPKGELVPMQTMKACKGSTGLQPHSLLTLALDTAWCYPMARYAEVK